MVDLLLMIRTDRGQGQRERPWVDSLATHASPVLAAWLQTHGVGLPHRITLPGMAPAQELRGTSWIVGGGRKAGEVLFIDDPLPADLVPDLIQAVLAHDTKVKRGVTAIEVLRVNHPVAAYLSVTDPRLAGDHPRGLYDLTDADLTPLASLYAVNRPETPAETPRLRTGARTPSNLGRSRSR